MKNKMRRVKGFTLVELLIVIALIAILSVAVLATINPIEQSNKARDSKVQNDAAEVLNAYERYYTSTTHYPWMDVDGATVTAVDSAYFNRSTRAGFGLCAGDATSTETTDESLCKSQTTLGQLIQSQELKDSFLSKTYTRLPGADGYSYQDELYVVKTAASADASLGGNSIYVCYVPKAGANRTTTTTSTWKLKALTFQGESESAAVPSTVVDATAAQIDAATFKTLLGNSGNDTLFRCVPE